MTLLSQLNPMLRGAMHSGSELLNFVPKLVYFFYLKFIQHTLRIIDHSRSSLMRGHVRLLSDGFDLNLNNYPIV